MIRIISGIYKGRRISAPKNLPVRPTTDMAKESLFNILNNHFYFDEIKVLDLFTGSGNISYELASRGCEQITAVDSNYGCVKFVSETAEAFDMPISVIKQDVFKFLETTNQSYDIIFADPPYDIDIERFSRISELVFTNELLNSEGFLIIEHSKHTDLSELTHYSHTKSYGGNSFSFFKLN